MKFNPPKVLKQRINKIYSLAEKANYDGLSLIKDRVLRLEKRYFEKSLGTNVNKDDINFLKWIVELKTVFPGSKIIRIKGK